MGRKKELARLRSLLNKPVASFVVLTGRRRIGKSRLLEEFAKDFERSYLITALAPQEKIGAQDQKNNFIEALSQQFSTPVSESESWGEIFKVLANKTASGRVLIVLDEISWMASGDPLFLPKLKNAWDLDFKKNEDLVLAVCGSVSSWIEQNLLSSTGFVGRVSETHTIKEISLSACSKFWRQSEQRISAAEKLNYLSVSGGVPRYLEELDPTSSTNANILKSCFSSEGFFFNEFERLFSDLFNSNQSSYRNILKSLVHGSLSAKEIANRLSLSQGGGLTESLNVLATGGFLARDFSYDLRKAKKSSLSKFRLSDNYTRFYLKYIEPHKDRIEQGSFPNQGLSSIKGWSSIMGFGFENLVLGNRSKIFDCLGLSPQDVIWDNPYFQTKTTQRAGCQIDYLISSRFNSIYLFEMKCSQNPIGVEVIPEIDRKIAALDVSKSCSVRPILITAGPVSDSLKSHRYFDQIITGRDLLS